VRWYYYGDLTVEEIAKRVGTKTPAVYRRLDRCLKKLKEILSAV
jgi:DNA-directed RNA polymerase specialized sigma24 family protein